MRIAKAVMALSVLAGAWLGSSCVVYTQEPSAGPERPPAHPAQRPATRPPPPPGPGPRLPADPHAPPPPSPGVPEDPEGAQEAAAGSSEPAVPQAPFDEPAEYQGPIEQLPPGAAMGRPPSFRPGAPAAYWIWQGPRGSWLLRTTTAGATQVFRGRVAGAPGEIVNVHPLRTEFRDRIRRARGGWVFSFTSAGHADGFTFMTREAGCVRFDLELDGGPQPKRIFIGRGELQPRSPHFVVCPAGRAP